jgi:hypothetical protein
MELGVSTEMLEPQPQPLEGGLDVLGAARPKDLVELGLETVELVEVADYFDRDRELLLCNERLLLTVTCSAERFHFLMSFQR